jgi:hypothetical protein
LFLLMKMMSQSGNSLSSSWVYSSQSLYSVINFRGVQPVFFLAVWKLMIPPEDSLLFVASFE